MSLLSLLLIASVCTNAVRSQLVHVTSENYDDVMQNSRLTFVSFTAPWCRFSHHLLKGFSESAQQYAEKYPDRKTVWGNVDCLEQEALCDNNNVWKFPTMKVYFYGHAMVEYRGSRHISSLIQYVEKMENTTSLVQLREVESLTQWQDVLDPIKGTLVVWFPHDSPPFELMLKAIALIHDQLTVVVPVKSNLLEHEDHKLWFSWDGEHVQHFNGSVTSFKEIMEWVQKKSLGMVRELTFENVEEIVESRKPMLILFRNKGDESSERKFIEAIRRELNETQLSAINPLLADGELMSHVVRRFNRGQDQLPFLLVDQFVHSYPAPWVKDEIFAEGNIREFVGDLLSGKHHRKFHDIFDNLMKKLLEEVKAVEEQAGVEHKTEDGKKQDIEETANKTIDRMEKQESVFSKLQPAKNRYSFAKEEL